MDSYSRSHRGAFASRGAKVYTFVSGRIDSTRSIDWTPKVETSFKDGSTSPYKGE